MSVQAAPGPPGVGLQGYKASLLRLQVKLQAKLHTLLAVPGVGSHITLHNPRPTLNGCLLRGYLLPSCLLRAASFELPLRAASFGLPPCKVPPRADSFEAPSFAASLKAAFFKVASSRHRQCRFDMLKGRDL